MQQLTTSETNTTSLNYTILLDKPGDFYEFTVDAVNNGTINGMIKNIHMTSLDEDVAKYLSYTATYLDGTPLGQDDVLAKNSTTTYKIRVEFKSEITAGDLSEDGTNLNLTFENEMDESEIEREVEFTISLEEADVYYLNYNFIRENTHMEAYIYKDDILMQEIDDAEGRIRLENVNSSSVLKLNIVR